MIESGTLVGSYRVLRSLGKGGMAEVYEAEDTRLGRKVALKVLPTASTDDPEMLQRFEKEARAVALLNHRGIVTVFEVGHTDTHHWFSMRLLPNGDLRQRMRRGLGADDALRLVREVAGAFAHAHARGFVHRDIKPENIMFDEDQAPVLTDFGIAKALDSGTQLTKTGLVVGTPRYISPEQAAGRALDGRSDLYSLGVILYEMLTGKAPFDAPDAMALMQKHLTAPVPRLPKQHARLQSLVDRLLAKDPNLRVGSADELVVLIDALGAREAAGGLAASPAAKLEFKDKSEARTGVAERVAQQLATEPDNQNLRFQLLRLYFDLERTEDFLREARILRYAPSGLNPQHWDVVEQMGRKLAPLSPLFQDSGGTLNIEIVHFEDAGREQKKYQRIGESPPKARALFAALARTYEQARLHPRFFTGLELELVRSGIRTTPLVPATQLSRRLGGARIFLKREDLARGGHASIAAVGQVYVAKALRKKRIVAGIRDLQLGVLLASAAARQGIVTDLWLDREEYDRQSSAIFELKRLGAKLHPVQLANYRNNDIREAALEEWLKHSHEVFWFMGLDAAPEPVGAMARDLTSVIGRECRRQLQAQASQLPDIVVARGGDNPDPLGLFPAFIEERAVSCVCVEPAEPTSKLKAAGAPDEYNPFAKQLDAGELSRAHQILGGLHYVSIRRELAWLESTGRVEHRYSDVNAALRVHEDVGSLEGVLLGLQTAHAMAWACEKARAMEPQQIVVVLVAERGDKDLWEIERLDRDLRARAGAVAAAAAKDKEGDAAAAP
jgi:tryptophan synthase beta subunit/serine/threonine protein kinase